MFSALRQGSVLYILETGEQPKLKVAEIVGITQPSFGNNFLATTININARAGDQDYDFKNVPSQQSVATYNNVIIAETKEIMSNEVDNMLSRSKNILDNIDYHKNIVTSCENILKDLNPKFAKEKERDEDINNLKDKIGGIENKMDQLLTLLQKENK